MAVFHFSLGDSTDGPIGYCANIEAPTAQNPELLTSEYLSIYFNPGAISPLTIDDTEACA